MAGSGPRSLRNGARTWARGLGLLLVTTACSAALQAQPPDSDWYMAGANPARTSWVSSEVRGQLRPQWYVPIEPYVSPKIQVIATGGRLYLSTARGLYCFDAASGAQQWVYPTSLPLGNSPTVIGDVAYVGGFDRRIHAVNAAAGRRLWVSPQAGAGFHTNPLVVGGRVIAGNRDGFLYAFDALSGRLTWKFKTDGPILSSAALYNGTIYFASNDSHAYAVSQTGTLVWKSAKLPGQGFNSWWPVVYRDPRGNAGGDRIIFSGSVNYRSLILPGSPIVGQHHHFAELLDVYPQKTFEPVGRVGRAPGPWVDGTPTLSAERILDYFERKPHRRSVFVIDPRTGAERETAPLLMAWTHSGARFPPVVGADGALYQQMNHRGGDWIASGSVGAWVPDIGEIAPGTADPRSSEFAADEPVVSAAGGRLIYSMLCCDRSASAYDITDRSERWHYFGYNLRDVIPGYDAGYWWNQRRYSEEAIQVSFGASGNGVYGVHGDQNPPIPYHGRVYFHRGNSLIALGASAGSAIELPPARTTVPPSDLFQPVGATALKQRLEEEVARILAAGHLRPGYTSHGLFDHAGSVACGDRLSDYWHAPADNLYPLLRALPHLTPATRTTLRGYIEKELAAYPPHVVSHIGWKGAAREIFDTPPEVTAQMESASVEEFNYLFDGGGAWEGKGGWGRNPMLFYVLWKYAQEFGGASDLYEASKGVLEKPPAEVVLRNNPFVANAFIAGYTGFLELERLAGHPERPDARATLQSLLDLRVRSFSKDSPYKGRATPDEASACQTMAVASNFMYLVPELATYLRAHRLPEVRDALSDYERVAPYWMASLTSDGMGENAISPMHDVNALFQAKALIIQDPPDVLERYLDVPGFWRGDMYYILNVVTLLDEYARPR